MKLIVVRQMARGVLPFPARPHKNSSFKLRFGKTILIDYQLMNIKYFYWGSHQYQVIVPRKKFRSGLFQNASIGAFLCSCFYVVFLGKTCNSSFAFFYFKAVIRNFLLFAQKILVVIQCFRQI